MSKYRAKIPKLSWNSAAWLLSPLIIVISLYAGSVMQELSGTFVFFIIGLLGLWLAYSLIFGLSLQSSLPFISLFFIKPLEQSFYFILLLFVVLGLIEYLQKKELRLIVPYPLAMTLLMVFGSVSVSKVSVSMGYTYFMSTVIVPVLTLLLFRNISISMDTLERWMQVIVYVAAFVGLYGVLIAMQNPSQRLGSFWVTAMTINGFYTVGFFFALTLALHVQKGMHKLVYAVAALFILLGMLYTYTRMAILAVAFGIFLFMLRMRVMRYLGMGLMLMILLLIPASMSSRIQLGFTYDISLVIRALAWYLAVCQILKYPIFGMGFSQWSVWYFKVIPLRMLYAQHTHNLFLNLMIDMGVIGALSYLYLILRPMRAFRLRYIKDSQDTLSFGFWVAMLALLFSCLTDIFIQQYSISILFWISLGLMISLNNAKDDA